jgi:hypothetical protein
MRNLLRANLSHASSLAEADWVRRKWLRGGSGHQVSVGLKDG